MAYQYTKPAFNYYQIIINNVPYKNGSNKTVTFSKESNENYISYQEVFQFLEDETGIPKKYFVLKYKNTEVNYVDAFIKYYSSCTYDTRTHIVTHHPIEFMDVRIHMNIDYAIYRFYKSFLESNKCEATFLEILRFADELFVNHSQGLRDSIDNDPCYNCYTLLTNVPELYRTLSPFKRFRIATHIDVIKMRYSSVNHSAKL